MGLEAAHSHGIVHRDVKPQNIIISMDGKVKVTDFGIARAASSNTISSNVMGSVHYSSPEQVRGGYSDEKSDIYSLGITCMRWLPARSIRRGYNSSNRYQASAGRDGPAECLHRGTATQSGTDHSEMYTEEC